jgi:hypothetical protein
MHEIERLGYEQAEVPELPTPTELEIKGETRLRERIRARALRIARTEGVNRD